MAPTGCTGSRGYKPETDQVVALAVYNLASWCMENSLQELCLVGQVVTVLSVQLVLEMFHAIEKQTETQG